MAEGEGEVVFERHLPFFCELDKEAGGESKREKQAPDKPPAAQSAPAVGGQRGGEHGEIGGGLIELGGMAG